MAALFTLRVFVSNLLEVVEEINSYFLSISISSSRDVRRTLLIQSRSLFVLASPLPPNMMSVWRPKAGSLLLTGATMVSIGH